jgi:predicted dehydrogenase
MIRHAHEILEGCRIGRPVHYYGRHFEDYLSDPAAPFGWRLDAPLAGRCGALGDLGCHVVSVARLLLGPIKALCGATKIVHPNRRVGQLRQVENEDHASALVRFDGGVPGVIEVSRIATGRKMDIAFEVTCERCAIRFDGERAASLFRRAWVADQWFPPSADRAGHPGRRFLPAAAHGIGFNDLKTIEIDAFFRTIAGVADTSIDLI